MTLSRARRNAKRLQAFLEQKKNQSEPEQALARKVGSHHGSSDAVLKPCIDQEVLCVDFQLDDGEPIDLT